MDIIGNTPPANIEAEESILGGILLDPEAMGRVVDLLRPDAFYINAHRNIYQSALTLHTQGKPTDLMTVTSWLNDQGLLEKVGGTNKLVQLLDRTVSAVNIDRYATLVMDKYMRRQLISAGHEIVDIGYDTTIELELVLDQSEQKIFGLTQERPQQGLVSISETLVQTFNEIESLHEQTALPGLSCDFYDLDAMTSGFQRSDLIIVAGRPSMGKCLEANSEIVLADGSIATIEKIYHQHYGQILTLQDNWQFTLTQPSAFVNDGIKPVFRVTTRLGRSLETTITHPFLTMEGWRQLEELKVGDKIAVPRHIPIFGTQIIPEAQVKLLAYLIGDGCLTKESPSFTNSNPKLREEFTECVASFNGFDRSYIFLVGWLQELELWGKSAHEKTIPNLIFKLNRSLVSVFLNRLFATNGCATVLKSGQSPIGYETVNQKLAQQIQHLLLRFGVIASLKNKLVKSQDSRLPVWQLDITDAQSLKLFIDEISIFGKEDTLEAIKIALSPEKYQNNCDLIPLEIRQQLKVGKGNEPCYIFADDSNIDVNKRYLSRERLFKLALSLDDPNLQNLATSEVYWDEIVAIEAIGKRQVYDLTIQDTHNFVANDICVHNTSFSLNVAANIAKNYSLPVAIFSLEMSKEQLAQRLLASEAGIESNRLRSGRISQNEMEPLSRAMGTLSELPLFIDDTANLTVAQMRSQARRLQAEQGGKLGLVLLDYLQLMEGSGDNRVQELSKITRSLKGLAREINAPVVALSQLSRGVEQRTNKRPMMSDLRESGSIEQDADLVIMLYRDSYYNPDSPDRDLAEIIIAKHRNGPTGTVKLLFNPQYTKFLNLQTRQGY